MNLVWFRTDLRLSDNPALFHSLATKQPTWALFVLTPQQHKMHGESPQKYEFLKAHINDLVIRLAKIGVQSMIREVPLFSEISDLFKLIFQQQPFKTLYFNKSYWFNEIQRDQAVKAVCKSSKVAVNIFDSNYLLPPGTVRKSDGSMYHVFTPYKNKLIEVLKRCYQLPLSVPKQVAAIEPHHVNPLAVDFKLNQWPIGEQAANIRLKKFINNNAYKDQRDFPALSGTSALSPYLAIGVISAQQCLAHALNRVGESAFNSTWVSELIWRDFYNDLMFKYPRLAKYQRFKPDAVDRWLQNQELLKMWQQGQTGFPIVDAGMRQLLKEGWMHNRVRMITASFLSKLCLLDWRLGEAHFMKNLLDGDLASNNGGWQWSSATGCDAAPYFRIFNPTTQSTKFDAEGSYIRTYVEELADLEPKEIHNPSPETRKARNYPLPVIDYKAARQQALDWFKANPIN